MTPSPIEVANVEEKYANYEFGREDGADEVPKCQQWAYTANRVPLTNVGEQIQMFEFSSDPFCQTDQALTPIHPQMTHSQNRSGSVYMTNIVKF